MPASSSSIRMPKFDRPAIIAFCPGLGGNRRLLLPAHSNPKSDGPSTIPASRWHINRRLPEPQHQLAEAPRQHHEDGDLGRASMPIRRRCRRRLPRRPARQQATTPGRNQGGREGDGTIGLGRTILRAWISHRFPLHRRTAVAYPSGLGELPAPPKETARWNPPPAKRRLCPTATGPTATRCLKPKTLCVCEGIVPIDKPHIAGRPPAPAGAGQDARHRAADGAAFPQRDLQDRPVLAEPRQGPRPPGRPAALGRALSRLGAACRPAARSRTSSFLDAKGAALPDQDAALPGIAGIVVLDGSWSQAKTLWWRNPWVLKARRIVLAPGRPSRYGALRREPRARGAVHARGRRAADRSPRGPAGDRGGPAGELRAAAVALSGGAAQEGLTAAGQPASV